MPHFNVHEAKTNLSRLLAQAASEGWVLVSNCEIVRQYPAATVW